jgi:hypothetical protein
VAGSAGAGGVLRHKRQGGRHGGGSTEGGGLKLWVAVCGVCIFAGFGRLLVFENLVLWIFGLKEVMRLFWRRWWEWKWVVWFLICIAKKGKNEVITRSRMILRSRKILLPSFDSPSPHLFQGQLVSLFPQSTYRINCACYCRRGHELSTAVFAP